MSSFPSAKIDLPANETLIGVADAAAQKGMMVTRFFHLLSDRHIIAVEKDGKKYLPEAYFDEDGEFIKFLPGVIALLADGGYSDAEILGFLFTDDDTLPGRPIDALHGHLAREVMRRAQASAF